MLLALLFYRCGEFTCAVGLSQWSFMSKGEAGNDFSASPASNRHRSVSRRHNVKQPKASVAVSFFSLIQQEISDRQDVNRFIVNSDKFCRNDLY